MLFNAILTVLGGVPELVPGLEEGHFRCVSVIQPGPMPIQHGFPFLPGDAVGIVMILQPVYRLVDDKLFIGIGVALFVGLLQQAFQFLADAASPAASGPRVLLQALFLLKPVTEGTWRASISKR